MKFVMKNKMGQEVIINPFSGSQICLKVLFCAPSPDHF